jgi:hypothetical protein
VNFLLKLELFSDTKISLLSYTCHAMIELINFSSNKTCQIKYKMKITGKKNDLIENDDK